MRETGIFAWFGYVMDMDTRLAMIRAAGFERVMLWWGSEYEERDGRYTDVPALARRRGLIVDNGHLATERVNGLWEGGEAARAVAARLEQGIRTCADCGVPVLVVHITNGYTPPPVTPEGMDILARACDQAHSLGVRLAFENLKRPEYLETLFETLQSPAACFCYDVGHEHVVWGDSGRLLAQYGGRCAAVHLHDNDGKNDQHRIPGDGTIDWARICAALDRAGYTGAAMLECCRRDGEPGAELDAAAYLQKAQARARALCRRDFSL